MMMMKIGVRLVALLILIVEFCHLYLVWFPHDTLRLIQSASERALPRSFMMVGVVLLFLKIILPIISVFCALGLLYLQRWARYSLIVCNSLGIGSVCVLGGMAAATSGSWVKPINLITLDVVVQVSLSSATYLFPLFYAFIIGILLLPDVRKTARHAPAWRKKNRNDPHT